MRAKTAFPDRSRLQRQDHRASLRIRHRLFLIAADVGVRMTGSRRTLDRELLAATAHAARPGERFWLPAPRVLRWLGASLCVNLPACTVQRGLRDWMRDGERAFHCDAFFLGAGDWSDISYPLADNAIVCEARELRAAGMAFRNTASYRDYVKRMQAGRAIRRNRVCLDRVEKIDRYFAQFVALFESIQALGVRPHRELGGRAARFKAIAPGRRWLAEFFERDIGVAVGPGGELYKLPGGQHRMAIALALDLPVVPVQVRLVHQDWLAPLMANSASSAGDALVAAVRRLQQPCPTCSVPTQ